MTAGFLVSFLTTLIAIPVLARWARSRNLLDVPNARSSHTRPTPRVGGVGLVAGVAAGQAAASALGSPTLEHAVVLASGALILVAISVVDDLRSLPALVRLAAQTGIAGVVVWQAAPAAGAGGQWPIWIALLTGGWIVGLVNAYNFMDGIDGIAGGQAIVAAAAWSAVGVATGDAAVAVAALTIGAGCAAFLVFNAPPATVFMGDGGSAFLGFVFAVLPLGGSRPFWSIAAAACFVWPFLFDTAVTLLRRLGRGENVLQAHRSHLYQRLTSTGLSHARVTWLYVGLAVLGLPAGIPLALGRGMPAPNGLLIAAAAAGLWWWVARRERRSAATT